MTLVGAAILPHNPLLVPSIGLQYHLDFTNTLSGISNIIEQINSYHVDSVVIISGHNDFLPDSFLINLCPEYKVSFEKFGDLNTKLFSGGDNEAFNIKLFN